MVSGKAKRRASPDPGEHTSPRRHEAHQEPQRSRLRALRAFVV